MSDHETSVRMTFTADKAVCVCGWHGPWRITTAWSTAYEKCYRDANKHERKRRRSQ